MIVHFLCINSVDGSSLANIYIYINVYLYINTCVYIYINIYIDNMHCIMSRHPKMVLRVKIPQFLFLSILIISSGLINLDISSSDVETDLGAPKKS